MLERLVPSSNEQYKELLNRVVEGVEWVKSLKPPVLLVSHYDADGLCAATAMVKMFNLLKVPYHLKVVEQLTPKLISELMRMSYRSIVFLDLGSGYLDYIKPGREKKVLVIDHHLPQGDPSENVFEVNPHRFGVDGARDVSSSALSFLLYDGVSGGAEEDIHLALIGALGDRQDQGRRFRLVGINKLIADEGVKLGLVEEKIGLRLYGIHTRPLVRALSLTMDPPVPNLAGNEDACLSFLKRIGVNPIKGEELRKYSDLTLEERRVLATELVKMMISAGYPVNEAERIFGAMYYLRRESPLSPLSDAREYAYVVNACGRLDHHAVAIGLLMHIRGELLSRALSYIREYRRLLFKALKQASGGGVKVLEDEYLLVYDYKTSLPSKVTGSVASILSSSTKTRAKVLVVTASFSEDYVKVSARKTATRSRVNIGEILTRTAVKVGGTGGGHREAGGALIPSQSYNEFIESLKEVIKSEG